MAQSSAVKEKINGVSREATEGTLPEGAIPTSLIGDEGQQKILELLAFRVAQTAEMDAHLV